MSFLTQAQRIMVSFSGSNKVFESQTIFTKKLPLPILAATILLLDNNELRICFVSLYNPF